MTDADCKAKCTADITKPCKAYEFTAAVTQPTAVAASCMHYYGELYVDATVTNQKCNEQVITTKTVEGKDDGAANNKKKVEEKVDEEIPEDS